MRILHRISKYPERRKGNIIVLAAAFMVIIFAFVVLTVDIGFITVAKTQLHGASDGAALAAGIELIDGLGLDASKTPTEISSLAEQAAIDVASENRVAGSESVYINTARDIRFGQRQWDSSSGTWQTAWGVSPYNVAKVTLHRDQDAPVSGPEVGDEKIPLLFAPIMGEDSASLQIVSVAGLLPGGGFRIAAGSSKLAEVLPIAFDVPSWDALLAGTGNDDYSYDPDTGLVTAGSDGILEINIYPDAAGNGNGNGSSQWTPGNRGTVDLGNPNNSTADLSRQILYGLNAADLSYFGGEISFDNGPFDVNGDTGISAGIKNELAAIIGLPRAIPLFSTVTSQGNNTYYTIVEFVGIRIMDVKLTGGNKYVIAQPAIVIDDTVVAGTGTVLDSTIFTPIKLVK